MRALLPLACGLLVTLSTVAAPSMAQAEVPDAGLPALWKGLQETAGQAFRTASNRLDSKHWRRGRAWAER